MLTVNGISRTRPFSRWRHPEFIAVVKWFHNKIVPFNFHASQTQSSLRSKRFQSSYCAKVRAEAKKKGWRGRVRVRVSFLDEPREETLATQARHRATFDHTWSQIQWKQTCTSAPKPVWWDIWSKNYMELRLVSPETRGFYSLDASLKITRKEEEPGTQDKLGVCVWFDRLE